MREARPREVNWEHDDDGTLEQSRVVDLRMYGGYRSDYREHDVQTDENSVSQAERQSGEKNVKYHNSYKTEKK